MRYLRWLTLAALVAAAGCDDLKDIMAVAGAVEKQYHMPVHVNLNNGSHLAITFQNASLESMKLDSTGADGFARNVAAFAKAHYAKQAELEDVSVVFARVSSAGPLTVTRTDAPYVFKASELP
jgi:hypothetical protein